MREIHGKGNELDVEQGMVADGWVRTEEGRWKKDFAQATGTATPAVGKMVRRITRDS